MGKVNHSLILDIGTTFKKVAILDQGHVVRLNTFRKIESVKGFVEEHKFTDAVICAVHNSPDLKFALEILPNALLFDQTTPLPIKNHYATPHTLGKDRLAAIVAAHAQNPNTNSLVIDIGTCITYDFITNQSEYLGGAISPGLQMRFQSLNHFTNGLPLVSSDELADFVGDSTSTCIASGVVYGFLDEIVQSIYRYDQKFSGLQVLLTGGDSTFFESKVKARIFAALQKRVVVEPNLVLIGLGEILNHNGK